VTRESIEGYHAPISFMMSPSRNIDPATTMRDEIRHAASSASTGEGTTSTLVDGEIAPLELDLTRQLDVILADADLALADRVVETGDALGGHGPRSRNHE